MGFKESYEKNKKKLLNDKQICEPNRKLFKKFFEYQEEKLRRINDNQELDNPSYKTLLGYVNKFRNVNSWFKGKAWKDLTGEEIKKVYRGLEDGKITNRYGRRFVDRRGYYNKVFKSKPFELAGKTEAVKEALVFFTDRRKKEVKFVNQENFKKLISVTSNPYHLALMWLSWDIGENINTLLQLTSSNFSRQENKETKEQEYVIWLPQIQLKRSRQQRSELTLFPETIRYLDIVLEGLKPTDRVFKFGYRQALKFFDSAVKRAKVTCEPNGEKPSWKDLRSGMACNLFQNYGWHSDDINLRLGHNITSKELESYFSYLAGKSKRVKKLHYNNNLQEVREELDKVKLREKGCLRRLSEQQEDIEKLKEENKYFSHWIKIYTDLHSGKITEKQSILKMKALAVATNDI